MTNELFKAALTALLAVCLLPGCGKEAGRIPFATEGTNAGTMPLEAGEVAFWTDLDVSYEGNAALTYQVELLQGGNKVAAAECQALGPMSMQVGWVETSVGTSRSRSGSGKMSCSAQLAKSGSTVVQTTLGFALRPARFALRRADLVVKQ